MNYVLVIGILACAVSYSLANYTTAAVPCSSDNVIDAVQKCLGDYCLTIEDIKGQHHIATAQELQESADHSEVYQQAVLCVMNATASCVPDNGAADLSDQDIRDVLAYCGDPLVSFTCYAGYRKNATAIESCIDSHWTLPDEASRSTQ